MSARLSLPSERDFAAFRLVKVQQRSTREAAETLRISQTRVCQVLDRVTAFWLEIAPAADVDGRAEQQLRVAESVAAERLDFFIHEAVAGFRQSQGKQTTDREVESVAAGVVKVRTTRTSGGDVRYLMAAARLSILASKLPAGGLSLLENAKETESSDTAQQSTDMPPLNEDCSAPAVEQPVEPVAERPVVAANDHAAESCDRQLTATSVAESVHARPVQPLEEARNARNRRRELCRKLARKRFLAAAG